MWLLTNQSTVEFIYDDISIHSGFSATYRAANTSNLSGKVSGLYYTSNSKYKTVVSVLLYLTSVCVCVCMCSDEQKVTCNFEQGMCFWRQTQDDDGDWERVRGSTFPPLTGPSVDHTLGNSLGGFNIILITKVIVKSKLHKTEITTRTLKTQRQDTT